jgi:hypothetical protein
VTLSERVTAVSSLGFTPRQAAFLTIVALHSGYCLRRQYAAFTGQKHGKNVRDFLDGLVDRGLAQRLTFRADRGSIYHVFGRRLYAAIGQEDNRNRRHAGPALVARKLMLLDFVLTMPNADWYATEADKVDLFLNRLRLPPSALPQRTYQPRLSSRAPAPAPVADPGRPVAPVDAATTRYCIQKLPLFVHGSPPSVHFVCVVTDPHASAVDTFVKEHAAVLRHLRSWTLHIVAPRGVATEAACTSAYQQAMATASLASIDHEELEWLNRTRGLVVRGDLRELAVDDLRRYRDLAVRVDRRLQISCG